MRNLKSAMASGAYVFVEVPYLTKDDELTRASHPPHTYIFNTESLRQTFQRYGFKAVGEKSILQFPNESCIRALFQKA